MGETHASTAQRGKRLNVVGALLSTGELFAVKLWEAMTAALFVDFLGLLMEHIGKPLVVILDNASVHKEKEIEPLLKVLQGKGLKLYFLTPYSPELNRIEKLWHKMKYEWMTFKSRDAKAHEADVDEILAGFGEKYKLNFFVSFLRWHFPLSAYHADPCERLSRRLYWHTWRSNQSLNTLTAGRSPSCSGVIR